jgi:hypothetical protein
VIDPREKDRLFEETITRNNGWIGFLARNNAPINSWQDLDQEIRIAFRRGCAVKRIIRGKRRMKRRQRKGIQGIIAGLS